MAHHGGADLACGGESGVNSQRASAGAGSRQLEQHDSRVAAGQVYDPHTHDHYAEGEEENPVGEPAQATPKLKKQKVLKNETEEAKDIQLLRYIADQGANKAENAVRTDESYVSWMIDYYQWYRATVRAPTDEERSGMYVMNHALAQGRGPLPKGLAVAPVVSVQHINNFKEYLFLERPMSNGGMMEPRRQRSLVWP